MGTSCNITVDVRDMLCAQALALVAKAMGHRHRGQAVAVFYNAADVKHDLAVWAREHALITEEIRAGELHLVKP